MYKIFKHTLVSLAIVFSLSFSSATKVLPRGEYADAPSKAFRELRDVIVYPRREHSGDLPPRLHFPAKPLMPHVSSPQYSAAMVKRTLLGKRQSCAAGYGYCYQSGRCCPNSDGNGKCCDDGTCVDGKSQTCCLYGGSCNAGTKCCEKGCAPEGTDCCGASQHCESGYFCCGNGKCAPNGGECCAEGSVCPSGKLCVIFEGRQTCCKDLSCDEETGSRSGGSTGGNGGSGGSNGGNVPAPVSIPSLSIPDLTASSFYPSIHPSFPSPTLPSVPNLVAAAAVTSFTFPTFTAESTPGAALSTFSTALTYYYFTVFITTTIFIRTESTFLTSDYTSTTTMVTALATDELDANLIFGTLALSLIDAPTARVTASGAKDFSQTHSAATTTTSSRSRSQVTSGPGVAGVGAVSAAQRSVMSGDWRVWIWGITAVGAGVGMVLL